MITMEKDACEAFTNKGHILIELYLHCNKKERLRATNGVKSDLDLSQVLVSFRFPWITKFLWDEGIGLMPNLQPGGPVFFCWGVLALAPPGEKEISQVL